MLFFNNMQSKLTGWNALTLQYVSKFSLKLYQQVQVDAVPCEFELINVSTLV